MKLQNWYEQKTKYLFIFLSCTLVFAFLAKDATIGEGKRNKHIVYSIRFEYFGVDANTMERMITIPLEESLSVLSGIQEMRSVSSHSQSVTTVYFHPGMEKKYIYLSLRDAVDSLYETLPKAVQKPRILSSESQDNTVLRISVFAHSLSGIRQFLEKEIKPLFEGVEGVSEVVVSGGAVQEILVEFDPGKTAVEKINPNYFANIIQEANAINSGACLHDGGKQLDLVFDTKVKKIDDIRILPVSVGDTVGRLWEFANITVTDREQDEIVRVNGKECVTVEVRSSFDGNAADISMQCREILALSQIVEDDYMILYDKGERQRILLHDMFIALLQSVAVIVLVVPFFFAHRAVTLLVGLLLPVTMLWTTAQLHVLDLRLDENTLSGMGVAMGLVADSSFVIAEMWAAHKGKGVNQIPFQKIFPSIVASCATTILCLVPLCFMDAIVPGMHAAAMTIILMLLNATFITCVFLPCFLPATLTGKNIVPEKLWIKTRAVYLGATRTCSIFCMKHKNKTIMCFVFFTFLPFILLLLLGKDISARQDGRLICGRVEFESGTTMEKVDGDCEVFLGKIERLEGVDSVLSHASKGSMYFEVLLDEEKSNAKKLAADIKNLQHEIPEGFVYVLQDNEAKGSKTHVLEIAVTGDDESKCREYAKKAAEIAGRNKAVRQCVLNFKEGEPCITITPKLNELSRLGLSTWDMAFALRQVMFGPVVDKWLQEGTESDIRLVGKDKSLIKVHDIENLFVPNNKSESLRVGSVCTVTTGKDNSRLYRLDNRSAAFFTLHLESSSTEKALSTARKIIQETPMEKGYGFRFSKEIEGLKGQYAALLMSIIGCIAGIFLLLTFMMEDLSLAAITTATIPASMFLPLAVKSIQCTPLESQDVMALIIVCGLAVNNAIHIVQSEKADILRKIQDKIQSALLATISTVLGCVPLLAVANDFANDLARTLLLGTLASFVVGVFFYPVLLGNCLEKNRRKSK